MRKYFQQLADEVKKADPNVSRHWHAQSLPTSVWKPIVYVGTHLFVAVCDGGSYANNGTSHYVKGRLQIYSKHRYGSEENKLETIARRELITGEAALENTHPLPRSDKQAADLIARVAEYDSMIGQLMPKAATIQKEREDASARSAAAQARENAIRDAGPALLEATQAFLDSDMAKGMVGAEIDALRQIVADIQN